MAHGRPPVYHLLDHCEEGDRHQSDPLHAAEQAAIRALGDAAERYAVYSA